VNSKLDNCWIHDPTQSHLLRRRASPCSLDPPASIGPAVMG
jgi:hypothetical protein